MSEEPRPAGPAFPTTRWSRVAGGGEADREALEHLARAYWRPIAAYARARWARTDEEAAEAAQAFFLWMLETGFLGRADPARGRFRAFVKRSLANFLRDRERERTALVRGGGAAPLPLDGADGPLEVPDPAGRGPEEALDDVWRSELLSRAATALEEELRGRGKDAVFEVFRDYFLAGDDLDYAAVAERHGLTAVDVSNALMLAKKRYRAHLRAAVLETVQSDDDLRAELRWLFEEGGR